MEPDFENRPPDSGVRAFNDDALSPATRCFLLPGGFPRVWIHLLFSCDLLCSCHSSELLSTEGVEGVLLPASPPSGTVLEAKIRCVLLAAWFTLT